jgi:hypothetical protein
MLTGMIEASARRRGTWFALGMVVAVGSMVAGVAGSGCSDDGDNARVIEPLEGGPTKETSTTDSPSASMCPTEPPFDPTLISYKPPNPPTPGKCSEDDLAAMKNYVFMNPNASNEDFENFVKNTDIPCHDCVFGDADGATWPPAPVKDGKVLTFDVGACYAIVTGSAACGKAVQNEWDCEFDSCALCASITDQTACRPVARANVCQGYQGTSLSACATLDGDQVCGTPFDSIRVQCVTLATPVPDGGADAALDAADAD